jgi:hypothetical protein
LRFKVNPRLAVARLGTVGWAKLVQHLEMSQSNPRPYFTGYLNGKSAVRVGAGSMVAGVHSWFLAEPLSSSNHCFLAGPSILHFHLASPTAFRAKVLRLAASPELEGPRLFAPSPTEETALALIRTLQDAQADGDTLARHLDKLRARLTTFSGTDVELLQEAGLLMSPDLGQYPAIGSAGAAG